MNTALRTVWQDMAFRSESFAPEMQVHVLRVRKEGSFLYVNSSVLTKKLTVEQADPHYDYLET